jgi:biopolymer transport protein ExbD
MRWLTGVAIFALFVSVAEARQPARYVVCDAPKPNPPGLLDDNYLIEIRLTIGAGRPILWNGTPVSPKDFAEYIADAGRQSPIPVFIITAKSDAPWANVVGVLRQIQRAGGKRIMFEDVAVAVRPN